MLNYVLYYNNNNNNNNKTNLSVTHHVYCILGYMFRPLSGHHQAFLEIKSTNAAYMLGFQHVRSICRLDS